jgi:hypothetical protein
MARYRSWAELREIIRATIAETATRPLSDFALSESEEIFFRARADRAVHRLARQSSAFKAYYHLPMSRPFRLVFALAIIIVTVAVVVAGYIYFAKRSNTDLYPLLAACGTVIVAVVVGTVGAWIAHRNAVRQNTSTILFARFAQTAFTDSLHRFHTVFGYDSKNVITREMVSAARSSGNEEMTRGADAVVYVLNYYEYLATGVLCGDLDYDVIVRNMRGIIIYYHDMCEPFIRQHRMDNTKAFENITKLRTHFREP